jgi:hypothetical protein
MEDQSVENLDAFNEEFKRLSGNLPRCKIEQIQGFNLKVDCNTPLENFFFSMGLVFLFLFIFAFICAFFLPLLWLPIWFLLLAAILFFLFKKFTDNYYILNRLDRIIIFHRSFMGLKYDSRLCSFDDVFCIIPNGRRMSSKSGSWWEYYLAILLKSGRFIRISDSQRVAGINIFNEAGNQVAEWLGVRYIPGRENTKVKVKNKPITSTEDLEYAGPHWKAAHIVIFAIFMILSSLAFYLFLVMLD